MPPKSYVHCCKYYIQTIIVHNIAFFSGTLFLFPQIAYGMWQRNKILRNVTHWTIVFAILFASIHKITILLFFSIFAFALWYAYTIFILLYFLPQRYDRYCEAHEPELPHALNEHSKILPTRENLFF